MDVDSIASQATAMSQNALNQKVGISVLKKAIDIESSSALQLIQAIPPAPKLPSNVGQNINVSV